MSFTAKVSSKTPVFPAEKLERTLTNLEKKGVTVVRGEAAEAALKLSKEGSALYRAHVGRPGTLFIGKNPSRLEVIEEIIHLGQHRKAGWQLPSKRALWEVEAPKKYYRYKI